MRKFLASLASLLFTEYTYQSSALISTTLNAEGVQVGTINGSTV